MLFNVFIHRVYGPIGAQQEWRQKLIWERTVAAPDPNAAVAEAKRLGVVAPIVETRPCDTEN